MATALGNCVDIYAECRKRNPDIELICRKVQEMFQLWARTPTSVPDAGDLSSMRSKLDDHRVYIKNASGADKEIIIDGEEFIIAAGKIWALNPGEWAVMISQHGEAAWARETRANFEGADGQVQVCNNG